jgi:alpha-1,3-rhamnosyltransferase
LKQQPLVTIGILSFNTGEFVKETIRSIFSSGYSRIEVICIDDGSSDNSAETLKDLSEELNFVFIKNLKNLGLVHNCNRLLEMASGKYFLIICDDLVLDSRITGDVEILESKPEVSFVCSRVNFINENSEPISQYRGARSMRSGQIRDTAETVWLKGAGIFSPTVTHRVESLRRVGGFDSEFEIEDRPLYVKLAKLGFVGWHRDVVTTLYRRHALNLSAKFRDNMFLEEVMLFEKFKLAIPRWIMRLKLLGEFHNWILVHNASKIRASEALQKTGLGGLVWTANSFVFKLFYACRTLLAGVRLSHLQLANYLRK